jgi:hypothetical protein
MGIKKTGSFKDFLSDRFSNEWKLLSETTLFLSRINELHNYENQLRALRSRLYNAGGHKEEIRNIRLELTELRRHLRLEGHDLSLAKQNIVFDGFRNDASFSDGFSRVVLFLTPDEIYWLGGSENHVTLDSYLERQMSNVQLKERPRINSKHFLWYKRDGNDLILSGSDSESKEDYAHLAAAGEANPFWFLSRLKNLK